MRLLIALVAMLSLCACSRKVVQSEVVVHDTLTIERAITKEVMMHDTITITEDKERIVTRTLYDTIGRPYAVTKVEYRNRYVTEQGKSDVVVVHDTIAVKQGINEQGRYKEKVNSKPFVLYLILSLIAVVGFVLYKHYRS